MFQSPNQKQSAQKYRVYRIRYSKQSAAHTAHYTAQRFAGPELLQRTQTFTGIQHKVRAGGEEEVVRERVEVVVQQMRSRNVQRLRKGRKK